ncbi:Hypothetical predicted protein, partial [Argonauta hians]
IIVGKSITFDVVFRPVKVQRDMRYKNLPCYVNEGEYPSLFLTLTGTCTGTPTMRDTCNFQTIVRNKDTKNILITNKSNQLWDLRPIIDGIYWQGPLKFSIEPQLSRNYEITYKPTRMTLDGKKHSGSILFPLPDGTALFYNLYGLADPPKAVDKIVREIPVKTKYTELLPVYNWTKQIMNFSVKKDLQKTDKSDCTTNISGLDFIDVPEGSSKNYKLDFHAYKEGLTVIKVTFTHLESGEYQFYEVTLKAVKSGSLGIIDLVTPVRTIIKHTVKIENPLTISAHFTFSTNIAEVNVPTTALSVPELSEGEATIEYQPIKTGEVTGKLEVNSAELGLYLYELNLKATPACDEKRIYIQACLGQITAHSAKFTSYAKQKLDYICKLDNSDFHVEKSISVASASSSGIEVVFDINFEPSRLGEHRATLLIYSPIGGEYIFPLFGVCSLPKPQGPIVIKSGTNAFINFRNVFNSSTNFHFQVDKDYFVIAKKKENIRPHKDHRISVGFESGNLPAHTEVKGKLIITCPNLSTDIPNLQWLYYLKGVV